MTPPTKEELLQYQLEAAQRDLEACRQAAALQPFRAGDQVKHAPTGETWVLACDQDGNDVWPAGWPETRAEATHCRLVNAATDDERLRMLRDVNGVNVSGSDANRRQRLAAHQLATTPSAPVAHTWGTAVRSPSVELEAVANRAVADAARLMDRAVIAWSQQMRVTPEKWLKRWRPVLRQVFDGDMSLRLIVEAKPIEGYEPKTPRIPPCHVDGATPICGDVHCVGGGHESRYEPDADPGAPE